MSSKPEKPKSSQELPAGTSSTKKQGAGTSKENTEAGQRASVRTRGYERALQRLREQCRHYKYGDRLVSILRIEDPGERADQLAALAYEYYYWDLYSAVPWSHFLADSKGTRGWSILDLCQLADEAREILRAPQGAFYRTKPYPTSDTRTFVWLFPVHLCISPLAAKEDVLDYVDKKWGTEIRPLLDYYHKGRMRVRKEQKKAENLFIEANRDVPSVELAEMINKEFRGESLDYFQVDSEKHRLKKRHTRR